jgi:hypothetical protein
MGMKGRDLHHLPSSVRVLRHPCELDLLLFFYRHPRSLLTSDRLAAYVGRDPDQVGRSLDRLAATGLLACSGNLAPAARLYLLNTAESAALAPLVEMASNPAGRRCILDALSGESAAGPGENPSSRADPVAPAAPHAEVS